jgi:hypothetical protein
VLLGRALGDLEAVLGVEAVTGVGASTDLAAVGAMAENLCNNQPLPTSLLRETYAGLAVTRHLVADVTAHASSGNHIDRLLSFEI